MGVTKPMTKEQEAQSVFEQWKYHIDTYDIDGENITEERLWAWANDPKRELICIFRGSEPREVNGFVFCPRCKEYKGVGPNV